MDKVKVTFQRDDNGTERTLNISLDQKFGQYLKDVQTLLGLREDLICKLVLKRTGKVLSNDLTPKEVGIKEGDRLILFPPATNYGGSKSGSPTLRQQNPTSPKTRSLVPYILQLTIISDGQQTETYEYPIELEEFHEDNPKEFFSDSNGRERQNFVKKLQKIVSREIESFEIDKILQDWCDDISLGYRTTAVKIESEI